MLSLSLSLFFFGKLLIIREIRMSVCTWLEQTKVVIPSLPMNKQRKNHYPLYTFQRCNKHRPKANTHVHQYAF